MVYDYVTICMDPHSLKKEYACAIYRNGIILYEDEYFAEEPRGFPTHFLRNDAQALLDEVKLISYYSEVLPEEDNFEDYERLLYHLKSFGFPSEFNQVPFAFLQNKKEEEIS